MACRTETTTINDREYSVTQWSAEKALLTKFKLGRIIGPAVGGLVGVIKTGEKAKEGDDEDIGPALANSLEKLFNSATPEEITKLIKECIIGVACDGSKITETRFTELYGADDLMEMYQVFLFVLKVNYGNLFKGQLVDRLLARVQENL